MYTYARSQLRSTGNGLAKGRLAGGADTCSGLELELQGLKMKSAVK